MRAALAPVRVRFDALDRGAARTGWRRLPVAPAVWALTMVAAAASTWDSSLRLRPAVSGAAAWSGRLVADGEVWRAATATVLTRDPVMLALLLLVTCPFLRVLERLTSSGAALGVWAVGAVWGFAGTTLALWLGDLAGWGAATAALATVDVGPSGGTAAVGAVVVALLRQRTVTVVLVGALLVGSALHREVADVEHLISFTTALLVAAAVLRLGRSRAPGRSEPSPGGPR